MMADQRTMAQLIQAPTKGYEDAIVVPAITTTLKFSNVSNTSIKLMLFPFSLEGAAQIWLEKEPPRSIFTWDDLVLKFINQFFPPSKTTNLRNEITNFQQQLHQLDTFYNALNLKDQDSLNSDAGGNFLDKIPRECLAIIESKSKVCYSRNTPVVAKVSTNTFTSGISPDIAELKDMVKALLLDKKSQNQAPATLKVVEESSYQAPAYQVPAPQTQGISKEDFSAYVKANDVVMRNMQTQGQNMQNQLTNLTDLLTKFVNSNNASTSSSAITTRSGVSYDGPQILPPPSFLPKVVENEPEATTDTVHPTNNKSTKDVQPQVVQSKSVNSLISEPVISPVSAPRPNLRPSIPYLSRMQDQKLRDKANDQHFANYSDMTAKRIDVIDMACEEYSQKVFGFSDVIASGNPTPYYDPIFSTTSPTLTPFGNSDFLLEEVDAFLAIEDDPTSPEVDQSYLNPKGNILLLKSFLKDDPSLPPPNQGNYLPEVELKDLPLHLEYTFLEGDNKLPVIIAKDLSVKEKTALIMVLKSHKRAIAWKISDIKGIDPELCTHKILMEEDFEPAVQHQIRVNPKIHDVIKQEVLKLLDAGLIYPISDSSWVSSVHCVPKKGGFTVVENEDNELILTRLVTGWRVCIDYRKLNEATRKDHFPFPFMDQMLERLAGNQTFAYRSMPFGLCNAPGTFQRCMMAIFYDMIEKTMEVFMDDFLVFGNSFQSCLSHLERMLKWCEDTNCMGDEHLDTISATESDEFIKSCVENLVPNPSESNGANGCDVPAGFTTFSNILFDDDYDSDSSDDQSLFDEDVSEKIYSNPLFDEEIIPMEIDQHSFNVESDLIESMPNHDSSVIISSKIDSLFDEFAGKLTLLKSIPLGIDKTDCYPEKEIRLAKRLLYDNSSPRPPEEIVSDNSNTDIESFSPSLIPNKDSDSHMEKIDLFLNPDDPMPPGIGDDDYDSRRDIPILEELPDNYSLSFPATESYYFDIPLPYRPPAKPPDGNTGTLNIKMKGDVSDQKVPIPNLTITRILNQEKSPDLLSHLGFEAFQHSAECPMTINGKNTPVLDVPLFHFYPS
nr:reverse transcriptase domain-containing protein [Tanacetum cinerariifolium]